MSVITPILVPQVNPNELEAQLIELNVVNGQAVRKGQVLGVLETTKSAQDLTAEADGYLLGLSARVGDRLTAGTVLAYLAESADAVLPETPVGASTLPADLRITVPARELAEKLNISLDMLPRDRLVTEATVRSLLTPAAAAAEEPDPSKVVIFGAGGHGKTLAELVRAMGRYELVGFLDDRADLPEEILGVPFLGGAEQLPVLRGKGVGQVINAVGGIGQIAPRLAVFERLRNAGFLFPAVIHPSAVIEPSAELAGGVQVFAQAYVGTDCKVGFGCIINTGVIVSHDCVLEDYVNLSPGAILAGAVKVGERALIGMSVTVNLEVSIGAGARIGNGATVKADVPEGAIVRAGSIWPEESPR